jgi:type VI secretion system protein ImpK
MDEPTIIGRRPIGPIRSAVRQPSAAPPLAAPGAAPRVVVRGPVPPEQQESAPTTAGNEMFAQIALEPQSPADVLVTAAAPLFIVVAQLRNMVENADVTALRRKIVEQLRRFEERAVHYQARGGDVSAARYVMCALMDEAVMTTPWGSASAWSDNSLLNQFHNETWGGEKVFQIVARVQQEPAKYLALLKLLDLCLLMGFEGRYRVVSGGRERLEDLREELGRRHRPSYRRNGKASRRHAACAAMSRCGSCLRCPRCWRSRSMASSAGICRAIWCRSSRPSTRLAPGRIDRGMRCSVLM